MWGNKISLKALFCLLLLFGITSIKAQELYNLVENDKVVCISYWNEGDAIKYRKSAKQTTASHKLKDAIEKEYQYDIVVFVRGMTEHSYDLEMSFTNFKGETGTDILCGAGMAVLKNLRIKYRTDEYGMVDTVLNLREITEVFTNNLKTYQQNEIREIKNKKQKQNL